jgi:hypothetical protein
MIITAALKFQYAVILRVLLMGTKTPLKVIPTGPSYANQVIVK